MPNTITGRILSITPTQYIQARDGKNYPKRELVIDNSRYNSRTGDRYESTPLFEFFSDLCAQLDQFRVNDIVTIYFDVNGSKYTNRDGIEKIITRCRPYKIEAYTSGNQQPAEQVYQQQVVQQPMPQAAMPTAQNVAPQAVQQPVQDDLPF